MTSSSSSHPPLAIPPALISLLLPLLAQQEYPAQAFWTHADGHLHPLLSAYLATYHLPSPTRSQADCSTAYAYVDSLEFPNPKGFLADIYRQWALTADDVRPAERGSWEHLLGALERSAGSGSITTSDGILAGGPASRVLVIDHAELLKFAPGGLGGLLLGLGEMTRRASVMVLFVSAIPWDYVRPIPSTFPDPVYLSLPAFSQTRASFGAALAAAAPSLTFASNLLPPLLQEMSSFLAANAPIPASHPFALHLAPFHQHLLSLAFSSHPAPLTLLRLSHALWPIYISPLVGSLPPMDEFEEGLFVPVSGGKTSVLDLVTRSKHAFRVALEDPARVPTSIEAFAIRAKAVVPLGQSAPTNAMQHFRPLPQSLPALPLLPPLPRYGRYLLLASYLASFAPPSKDLRLFSRARHDTTSRTKGGGIRKKRVTITKSGAGLATKVPQSLIGPKAVGLERVLAVWGALVVEHERPPMSLPISDAAGGRNFTWEDEVSSLMGSASLRSLLTNLTNQHLIQRASFPTSATGEEKIDSVLLKAGVGWEEASALGRGLGISIADYWGGDE